jgi:serine protease inhibitor
MNENENEAFMENGQEGKKKNKKIIILLIIVGIILIGGIGYIFLGDKIFKKNDDNDIDIKEPATSKYRMSGNGIENFDFSFLDLENEEKNVIYSPLSIKYALEMLSDGASGYSKSQIDAIVGGYSAKKYVNNVNLSFANAMFIKDTFKNNVKGDYVSGLQSKYNAEVIYDSFSNPDNLNKWVSDKTFNLINNLFDDVSQEDFILTNALAINMDWNKCIQASSNSKCLNNQIYELKYNHENYSAFIEPIMDDKYPSLKFNDNKINAKSTEIGASINNYDIVNILGEDYIRKTVGEKYKAWLEQYEPKNVNKLDEYMDEFIKELDSNYKKIEASTDFSFYTDDNVKMFAKDLKTYNGTTLQYIGIMPNKQELKNYVKTIDSTGLNELIGKLKTIELDNFEKDKVTQITGNIPLFKYDYQLKFIDDLKSLGVTDVFDEI